MTAAATPQTPAADQTEEIRAYPCTDPQEDPTCSMDVRQAATIEEAIWLSRRGYPSQAYEDELMRMPLAELQLRAENGDLAAEVVSGVKIAQSGKTIGGLVQMQNAMHKGSVYAPQKMVPFVLTEKFIGGPIEAAAHQRLAYLLGDWKAARGVQVLLKGKDAGEQVRVDERAMLLYSRMLEANRKQGRPVILSPRPFIGP